MPAKGTLTADNHKTGLLQEAICKQNSRATRRNHMWPGVIFFRCCPYEGAARKPTGRIDYGLNHTFYPTFLS